MATSEALNLKATDAYKTLCFKASAFKVCVLSSKAHARTFTVQTPFGKHKEGDKLGVWYIRAQDENKKPVFLSLPIGASIYQVVNIDPGNVKVGTISRIKINEVSYHKEISQQEDVRFVPDTK